MTTTDTAPAAVMTSTQRRSLLVLCSAMFLVLLDVSIVNVALPSIARGLGGGTAGAQSVVDSYTVPLAALLLTAGSIADRWGARRCFTAGLALFGVGSVGCAASPTLLALVGSRVVQGLGAAAMLPASLALISAIWTDPGARARAIALWSGVSGAAVAIGPVVGGALIGVAGWRLIFVVNAPVVAAAILGSRRLPAGSTSRRRVDWLGACCSTVALAGVVAAVIEAGRSDGSVTTLVLLAVAAVAAVAFVTGQLRSRTPMVPRELWRNRALLRSCAGSLGMNLVGNGSLLVLAFLFQQLQGRDAFAAGLATLPMFAPLTLVPLPCRGWMVRVEPHRLIRAGFAVGVVGELGLAVAVWRAPHSVAALVPGMLLGGAALGLLVTPLVASAVASAPSYSGLIGGLNNAARQVGTSTGVAVFGAVAGPAVATGAHLRMAWCFAIGATIWLASGVLAGRRGHV